MSDQRPGFRRAGLLLAACLFAACSPGAATTGTVAPPASVLVPGPSAPASASVASPVASAVTSPLPSVDVAAARAAFSYASAKPAFTEKSSKAAAGATVHDVTYPSVDGRTVSALLVVPKSAGPHPAVLFLHWYATGEPDGDRTEFLAEATDLAGKGVVSLLPQETFPWATPPTGATQDRQAVIDQVTDLRIGLDALLARADVDPVRVAVVGHDFGGLYAGLVASVDPRVKGAVVINSVPHFADWYLPYWHPVPLAGEAAYRATMLGVDPVTLLPGSTVPVLMQAAEQDRFVSADDLDAWRAVLPQGSALKTYAGDHRLDVDQARQDRAAFLSRVLGIAAPR